MRRHFTTVCNRRDIVTSSCYFGQDGQACSDGVERCGVVTPIPILTHWKWVDTESNPHVCLLDVFKNLSLLPWQHEASVVHDIKRFGPLALLQLLLLDMWQLCLSFGKKCPQIKPIFNFDKALTDTSKFVLAWRFDLYPKVFLKGYERWSKVRQFCTTSCSECVHECVNRSGVGVNAQMRPEDSRTLTR